MAFSADGVRLAVGTVDGFLTVWSTESFKKEFEIRRHGSRIMSLGFSPDGTMVVSASLDFSAALTDATTGTLVAGPLRHNSQLGYVTYAPDGSKFVTCSIDSTARLWDGKSGAPLGEPLKHDGSVQSAAFSPDSRQVVTGSADGLVRLWSTETSRQLGAPFRHRGSVASVAFHPDGSSILSTGRDRTAMLWDLRTVMPVHEFVGSDILLAAADRSGNQVIVNDRQRYRLLKRTAPESSQKLICRTPTRAVVLPLAMTARSARQGPLQDPFRSGIARSASCVTTSRAMASFMQCISVLMDGGCSAGGSPGKSVCGTSSPATSQVPRLLQVE